MTKNSEIPTSIAKWVLIDETKDTNNVYSMALV